MIYKTYIREIFKRKMFIREYEIGYILEKDAYFRYIYLVVYFGLKWGKMVIRKNNSKKAGFFTNSCCYNCLERIQLRSFCALKGFNRTSLSYSLSLHQPFKFGSGGIFLLSLKPIFLQFAQDLPALPVPLIFFQHPPVSPHLFTDIHIPFSLIYILLYIRKYINSKFI